MTFRSYDEGGRADQTEHKDEDLDGETDLITTHDESIRRIRFIVAFWLRVSLGEKSDVALSSSRPLCSRIVLFRSLVSPL